jgi:hypothetical protein
MIHIEHASVACRAVMATLWFEHIAHKAVSAALILWIAQVETPKHWDLAWIRGHRLKERPKQHEKEKVEENHH